MKIRHGLAIVLSGCLWMGIGVLLLTKGFSLLLHPEMGNNPVLIPYILPFAGYMEQASLGLIALGILIGFFKGKFVLAKSATRVIRGILEKPNPCSIFSMYSPGYLGLIGGMMLMGLSLRWIPIPYDVKGLIDIAVGSALTNGSAYYFRYFAERKKEV